MEIIRTNKEPRYKNVNVETLPLGSWFESSGEIYMVIQHTPFGVFSPTKKIENDYARFGSIEENFPDAILCDVKILYERVLE